MRLITLMRLFICYHPWADFDGIVFRSVQRPEGINYVLFDKGPEHGREAAVIQGGDRCRGGLR